MFIIEVIPLTILPSSVPQLLSYFFNKKLEKGAIVEIPFGNRKIRAVVVASTPLEDQKISLKKSGFQLKKISGIISEIPIVSNRQLHIALWISRHYFAPLGYCLKTVLPSFFLKKGYETTILTKKIIKQEDATKKSLFILSNAKETLTNLLPFIEKIVEKKDLSAQANQVALIVPDTSTIEYFYKILTQKHEVVKIYSPLSNKQMYGAWKRVYSGQVEIILGTRQSLFMPFKNLKLVIVDDILHEFYKSDMTPKYNTPDLAQAIASINDAETIFVSNISGVENYFHIKNEEYKLLDKTRPRSPIKIISMVEEIKNGNFSILSKEFKDKIIFAINQKKKILIFSPRRGYSGVLVCQNCGYAIKCKECGISFKVHKTTNLILVCHHCSRSLKMPTNCPNCNSFKLKTAGPAGTQKIYEEIQRLIDHNNLKKVPVLVLDTDVIKNEIEEDEIIQEIKDTKTSITIATQMIFSHRYDTKFDLIGVLNGDGLINTPDFKTEERLFYQIEKLLDFLSAGKHRQPQTMLIQTYNPENHTMLTASNGNYKDFYEKELATRKIFSYPPYSRLIKLTYRHKYKDRALYEARILSGKLKMAIAQMKLERKIKLIDSYPSFIEKERGLFAYNIVLKILPGLENLKDVLKYLPSNWSIDVDPRSII